MRKDYEIAVVIPVYNAKKYLKNCVQSVLRQTFKRFILILVDDGSTDGSSEICDRFVQMDQQVICIHQDNSGSVKARQAGVLSPQAQEAKYIFILDADDTLEQAALEKLYTKAERYKADCVCGNMTRMWNGIKFPVRQQSACFQITGEKIYHHQEIMDELYISCFGISNYPVNLVAKLYKTEIISKAIDFVPIVRFMGDDLSVTLRCMPILKKLVIIPDIIYHYRLGGGTSRYMPYMLDDFLALYNFKNQICKNCSMPQDAAYLIAVELINILGTWYEMYKLQGQHTNAQLLDEIKRTARLSEVQHARNILCNRKRSMAIADWISNGEFEEIVRFVNKKIVAGRWRRRLKQFLCVFS